MEIFHYLVDDDMKDFYFDPTNEQQKRYGQKARTYAIVSSVFLAGRIHGLKPCNFISNQGFVRQENFLYS